MAKQRYKPSRKLDPNISDYVDGMGVEASRATQTDYHQPWVTDRAWICGVAGVIAIIVLAFVFEAYNVLNDGLWLAGWRLNQGVRVLENGRP